MDIELGQTSGDSEGQASMVCCSLWGRKGLDTIVWPNNNTLHGVFPSGSAVENPPAMQETQVQSLGWEDPLEEVMGIHSSILA